MTLAMMREELLTCQHNVVIDTTVPANRTRSYLMRTKVQSVDSLLIVVVASRESVLERTRARSHFGRSKRGTKYGKPPHRGFQPFKFRSDTLEDLGTDYYVLTELSLLNSMFHPFRNRFLSNVSPRLQT